MKWTPLAIPKYTMPVFYIPGTDAIVHYYKNQSIDLILNSKD